MPYTIYPGSDLRSGLLSGHQSFGDNVTLKLDALRTERDELYYGGYTSFYYHFTPKTTTTLGSPRIGWWLPNDWTLSVGGGWGGDETGSQADLVTFSYGISNPAVRFGYSDGSRTRQTRACAKAPYGLQSTM